MSRGVGKRTVEWHDSWPTCFVTAAVKCLSVCLSHWRLSLGWFLGTRPSFERSAAEPGYMSESCHLFVTFVLVY
jgi:hypothetical protein